MHAEDATSCQWKFISSCRGLLPLRLRDRGAPAGTGQWPLTLPVTLAPPHCGPACAALLGPWEPEGEGPHASKAGGRVRVQGLLLKAFSNHPGPGACPPFPGSGSTCKSLLHFPCSVWDSVATFQLGELQC